MRSHAQAVFFEAHAAQRRVIEDWQLDEAALGISVPSTLLSIRSEMPPYDKRAEPGHYVEVAAASMRGPCRLACGSPTRLRHAGRSVRACSTRSPAHRPSAPSFSAAHARRVPAPQRSRCQAHPRAQVLAGPHIGKRGTVSARPFRVKFADGTHSDFLREADFKSSGLDEAAGRQFEARQRQQRAAAVTAACVELPSEMRDALRAVRERVGQDKLPLLSLLQVLATRARARAPPAHAHMGACTCTYEDTHT